jgi:EmrB/QacA subfamily drug resistance transporter
VDTRHQPAEQTGHNRAAERLTTKSSDLATSRPGTVLFPALVVVLVAALDLTVIAPLLPRMLLDLGINTIEADRYVWIVTGYLIAYTLTIPLFGRISDLIGRRNTFLIALAIFTIGSVVCAMAHSLTLLIVARVLQGLGGGAMLPVSMALVGDILPAQRRAGALGIVAAVDTLGWVLGPVWGAGFSQLFGTWRDVFWLNLPVGLIAAIVLLRTWRGPLARTHQRRPLDLPGAALLTLGLLCVSLGVSTGADASGPSGQRALGGSANPLSDYRIPLLALGILALIALIAVERRSDHPLIPLDLFGDRVFSAANLSNFLIGGALMVAMVNVPLQVALMVSSDRTEVVSAELLGAFCLAMALGGVVGGWLSNRLGYRSVVLIGLVPAAAGFFLMSHWPNHLALARMAIELAIGGLGFGLVIAPIVAAALDAARERDLGIASGLVIATRLLGMTIGISAMTGWAVSRLNRQLIALPPLKQLPAETLSDYLIRQELYVENLALPLTLSIIRDTFAVAAVICLLAIIPALLLNRGTTD